MRKRKKSEKRERKDTIVKVSQARLPERNKINGETQKTTKTPRNKIIFKYLYFIIVKIIHV